MRIEAWRKLLSIFISLSWPIVIHYMIEQIAAAFMAGMIAIAPSAVMAADMENGAQVFAGNCAACHAGGNNVIQNEKVSHSDNTMLNVERKYSNPYSFPCLLLDSSQRGTWGVPCWRS